MFLIIGSNSEIGAATFRYIATSGGKVIGTTRQPRQVAAADTMLLDFARPTDTFSPPDGVVSACIFVAVARLAACAADPKASSLVNCERTVSLVDRLVERGIYTLFLSTNQVFDGEMPNVPADAPTAPVSEYGRQKARTEDALRRRMESGAPIGILRLAKVVSPAMPLIEGWRNELAAGRSVSAFADMMMAPTPRDLVAAAIARMMEDRAPLIAQLSGPRDVSYFDVGRLVAQSVGADPALVKPVSALASGMPPGSTPRHTTLDSSYLAQHHDIVVGDAEEVLLGLG